MTRLALAASLLVSLVAVRPARAALPVMFSLEERAVHADAVLVARSTSVEKPKDIMSGGMHTLAVGEVIANWSDASGFADFLLDDELPGSSGMGDRVTIPADEDAILFVRVDAPAHRLRLLRFCGNSVVRTVGDLRETVGDRMAIETISAADFLLKTREEAARLRTLAALEGELARATGGRRYWAASIVRKIGHCDDPRASEVLRALPGHVSTFAWDALLEELASPRCKDGAAALRDLFEEQLRGLEAGDFSDDERFEHELLSETRPKAARILDVARALRKAGGEALVREKLLPYRRGEKAGIAPETWERSGLEDLLPPP